MTHIDRVRDDLHRAARRYARIFFSDTPAHAREIDAERALEDAAVAYAASLPWDHATTETR